MNKTETVLFCRYVKAMCPAQAIDEYTPDAWADVLDEVTLEDAKQAVQTGIKWGGWRFVDVGDVIASVRVAGAHRLEEYERKHGTPIPPIGFDENFLEAHRWLLAVNARIRSGEVTHPSQIGQESHPELLTAEQATQKLKNPEVIAATITDIRRNLKPGATA